MYGERQALTAHFRQNLVDALALGLLPCVLLACALMHIGATALLTLLAAVSGVAVIFAGWERSKPPLRQVLPPAVLAAIAVAGRVIFAAAPNVQPVTAICVISGAAFGKRAGFMTGALSALLSSFFLGLGAWTPWQMYSWGLVGYASGAMFDRQCGFAPKGNHVAGTVGVCAFGALASFAFGFIMNTWSLVGFVQPVTWQAAVAVYGAGFAFDLAHAASTVLFLLLLYAPWQARLRRISLKYSL